MLSNKKVMDGIWDSCTPMEQLPLRVLHPPSAVARKGSKWMASIWAELGDFGEFPIFAALHPENGGCGYSPIVYALTGWCLWSSLMSHWVKDSLSVCCWQVSMAASGTEGMEKVCRRKNWLPLCCMREKSCLIIPVLSSLWQHELERIKTINVLQ